MALEFFPPEPWALYERQAQDRLTDEFLSISSLGPDDGIKFSILDDRNLFSKPSVVELQAPSDFNQRPFYWLPDSKLTFYQLSQKEALKGILEEMLWNSFVAGTEDVSDNSQLTVSSPTSRNHEYQPNIPDAALNMAKPDVENDCEEKLFTLLDNLYEQVDNVNAFSDSISSTDGEVLDGEVSGGGSIDYGSYGTAALVAADDASIYDADDAHISEVDETNTEFDKSTEFAEYGHSHAPDHNLDVSSDDDSVRTAKQGNGSNDEGTLDTTVSCHDEYDEEYDIPLAVRKMLRSERLSLRPEKKATYKGEHSSDDDTPEDDVSDSDDEDDEDFVPESKMTSKRHKVGSSKKRNLDDEDDEDAEDDVKPPPKRIRTTQSMRSSTPNTAPFSQVSMGVSTSARTPRPTHPNSGRERNGPFTDTEHQQIFLQVQARRQSEERDPSIPKLRDQPFWEHVLHKLHCRGECTSRLTWGSLKNYWNRFGRQKSQFEERINGAKNGSLVASCQKTKPRARST